MRKRLPWMMATACMLVACAAGVDSPDDGAPGAADSGATVEASSGQDSGGSAGRDSAAAQDTGSSTEDAGSTGDDGSQTDAPSIEEAAVAEDSATVQDTGATVQETGIGQDTGTTTNGQCSGAKYDLEAVEVIASGTFTLCLSGVCGSGQCCFEGLSPGNVCVAQ
jgi:hypothetical protein